MWWQLDDKMVYSIYIAPLDICGGSLMIKSYIAYIYCSFVSESDVFSNKTSVAKYRSILEYNVFFNKTSVAQYRSIFESVRIQKTLFFSTRSARENTRVKLAFSIFCHLLVLTPILVKYRPCIAPPLGGGSMVFNILLLTRLLLLGSQL